MNRHPSGPPLDRAAVSRIARTLHLQRDPEGEPERTRLAELLERIAHGTADDTPEMHAALDALALLGRTLLGTPEVREIADEVPAEAVADVLDRLAAHDRAADGVAEPGTNVRSEAADVPAAGSVVGWHHEMRRLFEASPLTLPELAGQLAELGFHVPPQSVLDVPADARFVATVVELLGAGWVEGGYQSLYDAACRELRPDHGPVAYRRVSGLIGADPVDVETVGALIQAPVHDVPNVLARKRLLVRLVDGLAEAKRPVQVLVGDAGYGKSTVALAAAQRAQAGQIVTLWVSAPDVDALVDGLHQAAIWVGATARDVAAALTAAGDDRIRRLWALLDASPTRWLLVLDDAGSDAVGHWGWLHRSEVGTTIVTSRYGDSAAWGADAEVIGVGTLADDDGARLLIGRIQLSDSGPGEGVQTQARRLSQLLAGMPLALNSVGSLLAASSGDRMLGELVERLEPLAAATAVETTYRICLQATSADDEPAARELLRLLASFAPDEPLPSRVLDGAVERAWGDRDGIDELMRVGLIEELPLGRHGQRCIRIHPAVAERSRRDTAFDVEAAGRVDLRAIELLGRELDGLDAGAPTSWIWIRRLEPHIAEVAESPSLITEDLQAAALRLVQRAAAALLRAGGHTAAMTLLTRAFVRLDALGEEHLVRLDARHTHAVLLTVDGAGDLPRAELLLREVLADKERVLGMAAPSTLETADSLAWVMAEQGKLEAARWLFERVLTARMRVLRENHPDTLTTRHRLAWALALSGGEVEAVDEFVRVIEVRRAELGPDHMDVYGTRYRLAWALNRLGRSTVAEKQFRALRGDLEAAVGRSHPMTLIARARHAWTLESLSRFGEAEERYTELLADQEKILGAGHPRVLSTRHALASIALQMGRAAWASRQFRDIAELRSDVLGPDHPLTLDTRSFMAWALLQAGQFGAAEREFRAVLADRRRVLGERNPMTMISRHLLGRVLMRRGRLADADDVLRRLVEDERRDLHPEDRNLFHARHSLAHVKGLRGLHREAEAELRSVLADRTQALGVDHRETMVTRDLLSWILGVSGRPAEGLEVCVSLAADRARVMGDRHPHTMTSRYREAWLVGLIGRHAESRTLLEALLPDLRHALGDDHPDTLRCRAALVRLTRLHGDLELAEAEARRLAADQERVQGRHAVDALRAREEVGRVMLARGRRDEARAELRDVLEARARVLGDDHQDTRRARRLVRLAADD